MTYEYLFLRMLDTLVHEHIRLEYKQLLHQKTHERIIAYLEVAPSHLKTVLVKQNENQILNRFSNPQDVIF